MMPCCRCLMLCVAANLIAFQLRYWTGCVNPGLGDSPEVFSLRWNLRLVPEVRAAVNVWRSMAQWSVRPRDMWVSGVKVRADLVPLGGEEFFPGYGPQLKGDGAVRCRSESLSNA